MTIPGGIVTGSPQSIANESGELINVQNPFPTDGDSIYIKDLDLDHCDNGNFDGLITDYFDDLKSVNYDNTANNPKILKFWFKRTVYNHAIGIGCDNLASGFGTDVTVKLLGSGETVRLSKNFTGLDPNSALLEFTPTAFNGITLEFNTADPVCLSNITVRKAASIDARIEGLRPDGTVVGYSATQQGNFKMSLEELENAISTNNNSQLRTTLYDPRGASADITVLGEQKVAEPSLIIGSPFTGTILDTNIWSPTTANGGTVSADGVLMLDTNTAGDGSATVESLRSARKIPGTIGQFRAVGKFGTVAQADNVRTVGIYNSDNGAFFKLDGTTFKIVTRNATVDTEVSSGSFNGEVTTYIADTDIHRFVIEYSVVSAKFFIDNVLIHTVSINAEYWTKSTTLPIRASNVNSNGNITNNTLDFTLLCILRFGKLEGEHNSIFQVGTTAGRVAKYGAGELDKVVISAVTVNAVVSLYDGLSSAGRLVWSSGTLGANTLPFDLDMNGIPFSAGLTLTITGANASVLLAFE